MTCIITQHYKRFALSMIIILCGSMHRVTAQSTVQSTDLASVSWTPPVARDKAKTVFAPHPTTGNNIFKAAAEEWLADAATEMADVYLSPIENKRISDYVSKVGQNLVQYSLAPTKKYEFIVTNSEEIDAFTAGDGRVYITLGALRLLDNEDELVCVLAHEMGHDAFHHTPKTVTRQLFWMTGIKKVSSPVEVKSALEKLAAAYEKHQFVAFMEAFSGIARNNELEADRAAFYTAYKAGYNPRALPISLKRMEREIKKDQEKNTKNDFLILLLGSHPPTLQRALANSWESNWVKMPPKDERYKSSAFDTMKLYLSKIKS